MSNFILIVEDDRMLADTLVALLEFRELKCMVVSRVRQALEILCTEERLPGLIVSDLGLPDISGREFYAIIRADSRWQNIPFAFISGSLSRFEAGYSSDENCYYIPKPFDAEELFLIIDRALSSAVS